MILGANGMLGYTLLRYLGANSDYRIYGTVRGAEPELPGRGAATLYGGVDVDNVNRLRAVLDEVRPDVVVNGIGLVKQRENAFDPLLAVSVNTWLPHWLASWCDAHGARLIHFSTDCVFAGDRGNYSESDRADADDLYGRSKRLGEVDYGGHLTLRTSLIGHELANRLSLIDWFLGSDGVVSGYAGAVFSGLPTVEIGRLLADYILPRPEIRGLHHLGGEPIDKDRLLRLVARTYGHEVEIRRSETPVLDRSLNSERLCALLGYQPPAWEQLLAEMHLDYLQHYAPLRRTKAYQP